MGKRSYEFQIVQLVNDVLCPYMLNFFEAKHVIRSS
jgi:hypothetical protein